MFDVTEQPLSIVKSDWIHQLSVKSRKNAHGHQQCQSHGGPVALLFHHPLSRLSLPHISLQLTKCHASERCLISPASQTFYFFILLSPKGHIFTFTGTQSTRCSTQPFLASYCPGRRLFRIRWKIAHRPQSGTCSVWQWILVDIPCWLIKVLLGFVIFLLTANKNTLFFLPTQSQIYRRTQEKSRSYAPTEK